MNILQVKYVLEIAKYQNISRAADALYVSQPALSLQIKKLEEELGFALFVRTPHGVRLSQNGEIFREKATAVMSCLLYTSLSPFLSLFDLAAKSPHSRDL